MSNRGKTVVCDRSFTCVYGSYNPSNGQSAHMRLASAAGISPAFGASYTNGNVGLRSESINNTNYGRCDLAGTSAGNRVEAQIRSGNMYSVNQYKSRN